MMPGALLEVRTSAPRRTARLLRERLAGASVGLFGDCVHVVARDVVSTQAAIRELVASAGFELLNLRPVDPSLEDVFVSVTATPGPSAPPDLSFNR
jgi:ABC-2 type transport system ATP-binding protein